MHEWSLTELRELCAERGWTIDQKPDPERGLYAVPGGLASLRLNLPGGGAIAAQSPDGILRGCLPQINGALHELGIGPVRDPEVPNQAEHGGRGGAWVR